MLLILCLFSIWYKCNGWHLPIMTALGRYSWLTLESLHMFFWLCSAWISGQWKAGTNVVLIDRKNAMHFKYIFSRKKKKLIWYVATRWNAILIFFQGCWAEPCHADTLFHDPPLPSLNATYQSLIFLKATLAQLLWFRGTFSYAVEEAEPFCVLGTQHKIYFVQGSLWNTS